jgi:hypothetical protein
MLIDLLLELLKKDLIRRDFLNWITNKMSLYPFITAAFITLSNSTSFIYSLIFDL